MEGQARGREEAACVSVCRHSRVHTGVCAGMSTGAGSPGTGAGWPGPGGELCERQRSAHGLNCRDSQSHPVRFPPECPAVGGPGGPGALGTAAGCPRAILPRADPQEVGPSAVSPWRATAGRPLCLCCPESFAQKNKQKQGHLRWNVPPPGQVHLRDPRQDKV